jgi:two-component system, LytTR family, response regulator
MKCIITDDEQNSRETLRHLLAAIAPDVIVLAEAKNTEQAKNFIEKLKPDLLFLDINMPGQTGIEFLEEHGPVNCPVIFTTAYNEYAVKAFRLNAIDFLLKPIDPDELETAIDKVKKQPLILDKQQINGAKNIIGNNDDKKLQKLTLPTAEGIHFIDMKDIIWLESMGAYTKFHIEAQNPVIVSKGLKEYEDMLTGFSFLRVHQSNIINLQHIKKYVKGDGGQVWMSDGAEIEVSRRKKDEVLEALKKIAIK